MKKEGSGNIGDYETRSRSSLHYRSKLFGELRWESAGRDSSNSAVCVAASLLLAIAGLIGNAPYWAIASPILILAALFMISGAQNEGRPH